MRLILLGFIVITSYLYTKAEDNECDNQIKPSGRWQISFEPRLRTDTYCSIMMTDSPKNMEEDCKKRMTNYFKQYRQKKSSVRWFAYVCKLKMGPNWDLCIDILLHFQSFPYCWTMDSLSSVLYIFDKKKLLTKEKLKRIKLSKSEFDSYRQADLDIYHCMDDMHKSFRKTKNLLNVYIKMWRDFFEEFNMTPIVCSCTLVLGIQKLSIKLEENLESSNRSEHISNSELQNDNDESVLKYLYYNICFDDNDLEKRKYWTKEKLEVLISQSHYISLKNAVVLLKFGTALAASGWYTEDKPETQWPLEYLMPGITNEKGEITDERIIFFSKIIEFGFSPKEYNNYISLLEKTKGFRGQKCVRRIMETLLSVGYYSEFLERKVIYWKEQLRSQTIIHLELLIKMFINAGGKLCADFVVDLQEIEEVVKICPWSIFHTNQLISLAITERMVIDNLPNALLFCTSVTNAIISFMDKKPSDFSWPPDETRIMKFRKKVFLNANCIAGYGQAERELIESNFDTLLYIYKKIELL